MAEIRTTKAVEKLIVGMDRAEAEALIYLLRVADAHQADLLNKLPYEQARYVIDFGSSMETAIELTLKD